MVKKTKQTKKITYTTVADTEDFKLIKATGGKKDVLRIQPKGDKFVSLSDVQDVFSKLKSSKKNDKRDWHISAKTIDNNNLTIKSVKDDEVKVFDKNSDGKSYKNGVKNAKSFMKYTHVDFHLF